VHTDAQAAAVLRKLCGGALTFNWLFAEASPVALSQLAAVDTLYRLHAIAPFRPARRPRRSRRAAGRHDALGFDEATLMPSRSRTVSLIFPKRKTHQPGRNFGKTLAG
jgi:hypothetical protein